MLKFMQDVKQLDRDVNIHIADGSVLKSKVQGNLVVKCQGKSVIIEALIVPNLKHNLLSVSRMTIRGAKVIIEQESAFQLKSV